MQSSLEYLHTDSFIEQHVNYSFDLNPLQIQCQGLFYRLQYFCFYLYDNALHPRFRAQQSGTGCLTLKRMCSKFDPHHCFVLMLLYPLDNLLYVFWLQMIPFAPPVRSLHGIICKEHRSVIRVVCCKE